MTSTQELYAKLLAAIIAVAAVAWPFVRQFFATQTAKQALIQAQADQARAGLLAQQQYTLAMQARDAALAAEERDRASKATPEQQVAGAKKMAGAVADLKIADPTVSTEKAEAAITIEVAKDKNMGATALAKMPPGTVQS